MSEIDSFLLTSSNPSAHRYTVRKGAFEEVRPRLVARSAIAGVTFLGVVLWNLYDEVGFQDFSSIDLYDFMPLLMWGGIVFFSIFHVLKKQRAVLDSFVLIVEADALVCKRYDKPDLRILKKDILSINRNKAGAIIVKNNTLEDTLVIPAQIADREQLEVDLQAIMPIVPGGAGLTNQLIGGLVIALILILTCVTFIATNKIVVGVCGVLFLITMAGAILITVRSKHLDRRMRRLAYIGVIPLVTLGMAWFDKLNSETPPAEAITDEIDVREGQLSGSFRIYFARDKQLELAAVQQEMARLLPGFHFMDPSGHPRPGRLDRSFYAVSFGHVNAIDTAGRAFEAVGLSESEKRGLSRGAYEVRLVFFTRQKNIWATQRTISQVIYNLASGGDAVVFDGSSAQYFSVASWKAHRMDNVTGNPYEDVTSQIRIRTVATGQSCRTVTMGMDKFYLPDIAVEAYACRDESATSNLVRAVAQSLFEYPFLTRDTTLTLRPHTIRNKTVRDQVTQALASGAPKETTLAFQMYMSRVEYGDTPNTQLVLSFKNPSRTPAQAELHQLVTNLFGAADSLKTSVKP